MLIRNKKEFAIGFGMTAVFFAILAYLFTPSFGGKNAFEASDGLFNSISKASTNHFPTLRETILGLEPLAADQNLAIPAPISANLTAMLQHLGVRAEAENGTLHILGSLNAILKRMVTDSQLMYANNGQALETSYGIPARQVAYAWWVYAGAAAKAFKHDKRFASAKVLEEVRTRAVEVGYNYYGVEATPVTERAGITAFALIAYVVYTMWWGFSIFFLAEGLGLVMKKSAKTEV